MDTRQPFEELVADQIGPDFVRRGWLHDQVERALRTRAGQYVLLTGEPGAGKTSVLAALADAHPDWLRYFIGRGAHDVQSFLLSVGHQLANAHPELFRPERLAVTVQQDVEQVKSGGRVVGVQIADLVASPFHRTATLRVEQRLRTIEGSVTGVEVQRAAMEPRLLEPDNLATLALLGPAEVLLAHDPDATIVIVLDALDELVGDETASSLPRWLATGANLPPNVRLVLSSRPHPMLGELRARRGGQLTELVIDPESEQVGADLLDYAQRALGTPAVTEAGAARGRFVDQFQRNAARRAAGNFLYLATYARAVNEAAGDPDLLGALLSPDVMLPGLAGLYRMLIEAARNQISRLGLLEIREPTAPADTLTPAWEGVGQPVLGVLTVARDRLTVEQLCALGCIRVWPSGVRAVLERLRWLVETRDGRVVFRHAAIGEFLASAGVSASAGVEPPDWAVDEAEWHERIVRHYRDGAASWAVVKWDRVDHYGLIHLAEHVVHCPASVAGKPADLVCAGLRRGIQAAMGSDRRFTPVVEAAAGSVLADPRPTDLPTVLYLAVVRRQLSRSSRSFPPAVLGLLVRLGRIDEAVERAVAMPPSRQQFEAVREVLRYAPDQHAELRELLVEAALTIPGDDRSNGSELLTRAAEALAPHDLPRALRLWDRALTSAKDPHEPPDLVYRAAAAGCVVEQAARLITPIRSGRAGDYLDLAARAESGTVPKLLRLAEESLAEQAALPGKRVHCLARLADAWARIDPQQGSRILQMVRAEAGHRTTEENERLGELAEGLADAAEALVDTDRTTAQQLLERLAGLPLNGRTDRAYLRAARLWAVCGAVDRARRGFADLISWNNTVRTKVMLARAIDVIDRPAALRMLEQAHSDIPFDAPGEAGLSSQLFRESDLRSVALALASYDMHRAEAVAREMANVSWAPPIADRYSVLAELAHLHLNDGRVDDATGLLDETLRFLESPPPLLEVLASPPFRRVTDGATASSARAFVYDDSTMHLIYKFNHNEGWRSLRETRLFRDPAEVVTAMTPGAWAIGNPYRWGRTLRVLAETIASRELGTALDLVRTLTDRCERAVGLAGVFRAADAASAPALWREFTEALAYIDRYEWLIRDQDDHSAFAYLRPDHRARFDAAIRIMPYEADSALRLLTDNNTAYLEYAFQFCFASLATARYTKSSLRGERPFEPYRQVHETLVTIPPPADAPDPLLITIVRTQALANEYIVAHALGRTPRGTPQFEDLRYSALLGLVRDNSRRWIEHLLDGSKLGTLNTPKLLPAAAALVALAAQSAPHLDGQWRELGERVVATARASSPAIRAATLLHFARSSALRELVDPVELLTDAQRQVGFPTQRVDQEEAINGLFPVLFEHRPDVALRLLYDTVQESWAQAMALLEHGAEAIVDTLGAEAAASLHKAIRLGLECTSPDGSAPADIDGVTLQVRPKNS